MVKILEHFKKFDTNSTTFLKINDDAHIVMGYKTTIIPAFILEYRTTLPLFLFL